MADGLEQGAPPEEWNLLYPERVAAVHRGFIEAGSQVILTNTFGGTCYRLKLHDLQDRTVELNKAAAAIARAEADSAPQTVVVAGSMGPTGELLVPMGTMTFEEARDAFAEQATGLVEGGVDIFWVETMSDLEEARAAIEGARSVSDLPIVATMSFDTHGRTMMGVQSLQALEALREFDLAAIGANCGANLADTEAAVRTMKAADPRTIVVAKANAGIPRWEGSDLVYDGTPEVMAGYARRARQAGAQLIGACCGSTPEHIRALASALADQATCPQDDDAMAARELAGNDRPPQAAVRLRAIAPAERRRRRRRHQ